MYNIAAHRRTIPPNKYVHPSLHFQSFKVVTSLQPVPAPSLSSSINPAAPAVVAWFFLVQWSKRLVKWRRPAKGSSRPVGGLARSTDSRRLSGECERVPDGDESHSVESAVGCRRRHGANLRGPRAFFVWGNAANGQFALHPREAATVANNVGRLSSRTPESLRSRLHVRRFFWSPPTTSIARFDGTLRRRSSDSIRVRPGLRASPRRRWQPSFEAPD
jgi:hypothetical protein